MAAMLGVLMLLGGVAAWAGDLATEFANPGPEFRGKPFWSWNGELREDELLRQVHILKDMGMGGYFMHSRTGLATEYLGEEWFKLINTCADEGQRLGMEAWLYDEDRWPSGTAGGLVTANPKFSQQFMTLNTMAPEEFTWREDIVAAFACKLDDTAFTDCRRMKTTDSPADFKGKTILVFTIETAKPSSFFNGNTEVDRLSREATDAFIELTHEKYREKCGDRLGKSIPGIFTDEPHRGPAFSGFAMGNPNRLRMTPWTGLFAEEFQKRFGYDIIDSLPELFLKKDGEAVAPVKWHYMELLQQLFLENWCKPFREWCDREHMIFTGHFLHEDSLSCQAAVHGSLMRAYEYQEYPGVDVLTEGNRNYWIVKQLSSVARQLGQKKLLSELYGCTGWQFNFESHKAVGDWQALFGINLRCHHLSWYTMAGEAKRDYPASIFFQSGWWRDYHFVEDYYARLNMLLSQGRPACDVLVLNPIESVWCQVGVGWADGLSARTKELHDLEKAYSELFFWLAGSHIDFDYGDEEMFARLCRVERDGADPILRFGKADYRAVIVPKMTTIRSSSLKLLDAFRQAGGRVIFAGEAPPYVDAAKSKAAAHLAGKTLQTAWDKAALVEAVKPALRMPVEITGPDGHPFDRLFCQLRETDGARILAVINTSTDTAFENAIIRVKGEGAVSEWKCLTGERRAINAKTEDGWTSFKAYLPPTGEHVYLLTPEPIPGLAPEPTVQKVERHECAGPYAYSLNEQNVCVLDMGDFQIDDQPVKTETEILKIDRAVRDAFGLPYRGGEMVQPWYSKKFEAKPEPKGKVRIVFPFEIDAMPAGPVQLAIEEPGNYAIAINGKPLEIAIDGWWVDPALKTVTLPAEMLVPGPNRVELTTAFRQDMNLEALYLLGAFGVRLDGTRKTLTKLPERLAIGDITTQGLPFYSGALTYEIPVTAKPGAGQTAFLVTPKFEGACVKVTPEKIIPWQPYEADVTNEVTTGDTLEVQVVLTRRNTFGPLHQVPLRADGYGPGNWTTDGDGWSQNYQLYPAGLLEPPLLSIRDVQ